MFHVTSTCCLTGLQMGSFFVEQGSQMDRRISFPGFSIFGHNVRGGQLRIPAASLALFNTVSIIALIPLYDRGLVPLLSRFGKKLSLLQRIGGFCRDSMNAWSPCLGVPAARTSHSSST